MLENYFQQIESIITPVGYSRTNVKSQLLNENVDKFNHINDNNFIDKKNNTLGNISPISGFNSEKQDRISKMRKETEGKLENPDIMPILYQNEHETYSDNSNIIKKPRSRSSRHYDINNFSSNDIKTLMEKIHTLNCKNMNYRYSNEQLKRKVAEIEKNNKELQNVIKRNEIDKDKANIYLLRLETMLHNMNIAANANSNWNNTMFGYNDNKHVISLQKKNKNQSTPLTTKTSFHNNTRNISDCNSRKINDLNQVISLSSLENAKIDVKNNGNIVFIIEDNQRVINNNNNENEELSYINNIPNFKEVMTLSSPLEIKSFIMKTIKEYSKLKHFQSNVYCISTKYDDINEHLRESLNLLQNNESNELNELHKYYEQIIHELDETLQTKQKEYNFLLSEKDDQINVLKEQLITISNENELRKKDRIKEQGILQDHENQIGTLKEQLGYFSDYGDNPYEKNNYHKKNLILKQEVLSNKLEQQSHCNKFLATKVAKRIEPAQKTIKNLIYKIEKEFNLDDKNTAHFLGTLTK